jgi:hypothetical protein
MIELSFTKCLSNIIDCALFFNSGADNRTYSISHGCKSITCPLLCGICSSMILYQMNAIGMF